MSEILKPVWITLIVTAILTEVSYSFPMSCTYGERGSLTVYCVNATSYFFKLAPYRFDHLDETLKCVNCSLTTLEASTFDISGNQIKTLDIRNSSVTKIWPKAFIGLIFMEKLLLSYNPITIIFPGAFAGIRKVKYLELESSVSSLEQNVFQELHTLEVLILRKNKLSVLQENTFAGLRSLKILDLSFNQLKSVNNTFDPLVSLRILKLQYNQIIRIYGNEFSNLKALLILNLSNNVLTNFTINIDSDNHLRILNLATNNLTSDGVKMGTFQNLHSLEELDLSYNNFQRIPPKFFHGLFLVRIINLHHNQIKGFSTGSFTGLPHLMILNVSNNYLESAEVTGRLLLHSLHTLDISNNRLKKFDYIDFIARCPRIAFVNLLGNDLPCETAAEIQTLFREDHIMFEMNIDPLQKCSDNVPKSAREIVKKLLEEKYEKSDHKISSAVWIILMTIIIVAIAILFYVQYFIIYKKRLPSFNLRIRGFSNV